MREKNNPFLFESMPVPDAVRTMAVPTVLGQLIILVYNMADTFFLGRTGNPCMVAAAALILPVYNLTLSIAGLSGVGGGAQISRLLGEGRKGEAENVFSFSVWISVLTAAAFSLLVLVCMDPLLSLLGAGENTRGFAASYAFCVIVLGGLPTVLGGVLANMLRSVGESGKAGTGVMMGGLVNIVLDPLFMFVLLPRGNEILGAGLATCLSNCLSCLYFILVIRRLGEGSVLRLHNPFRLPERESVRMVLTVGIPSSVDTLLFDLDYVVIGRLMSGHSDIALAAIGIVLKAERLPMNVGIGICQAMVPIVAYNYASGDHGRMREVITFCRRLGIGFALVSVLLYEWFAPGIMRIFISEAETVALGTDFLRIRCLATVFKFLCFFFIHLFNGFGRGKESLFLGIFRWAFVNIPMLFILHAVFGMYGVVWGQFVSDLLVVIVSALVYRRIVRDL